LLPFCAGKSGDVAIGYNNNNENSNLLRRFLAATETISTADCNNVRVNSYHARLDLYYFYLLEFEDGAELNLRSVGKAIATELVKVLNECDQTDRPKFAVALHPSAHVFSEGGKNTRLART